MKAKLRKSAGPGAEAVLIIGDREYCVRDGFSWAADRATKSGGELEVELSAELDTSWSWERIFSANPKQVVGLQPLGGWSYLALGRILSADPVRVDCGILVEERAIFSHDPSIVGAFVGFRIEVLDASG
jgi:hypothetical protein